MELKNYYESEGSVARGPPKRGIFIILAIIAFFILASTISQIIDVYLNFQEFGTLYIRCLLYTSPSPRDGLLSRMPSSA